MLILYKSTQDKTQNENKTKIWHFTKPNKYSFKGKLENFLPLKREIFKSSFKFYFLFFILSQHLSGILILAQTNLLKKKKKGESFCLALAWMNDKPTNVTNV